MDGNFWGSLLKQVGSGTYREDKQKRKDNDAEIAYKEAMMKYYQDQLTLEQEKEAFDQKLQLHKLDLETLKRGTGGGEAAPKSTGIVDKEFKNKDLPVGTAVDKTVLRNIIKNEVTGWEKKNGRTTTSAERRKIASEVAKTYGLKLDDVLKD